MIKRICFLIVVGLMVNISVRACDACGCGAAAGGIGIGAAYDNNFVGIGWQLASFRSTHDNRAATIDNFHTLQVSARYHITDRFKLLAFLPYSYNERFTHVDSSFMSGLSDVRVLGSYTIFGNREVGDNSTIFLEVGAGMKLPTGRYDANIHDSNLPENFNLGNGSFGYIFQPNFVWKYKKNGLVFNGNYTYNQSSESGYHFGSQISSQILLFREFSLTSSLKLIPNIGTQYERIGVDTYNNGNSVHGTGGEGIFGAGGLTVRYKSLRASFTYSEPLQEDYSQGEVEAQRRLSAQLTFNF